MLRPIQPYVEYVINQDYIVEFLCINKKKPELGCHGKCHLVKGIKKQQDNETKSLSVSLENYPIGFVNIYRLQLLNTVTSLKKSINTTHQKSYYFEYHYSSFQPPDFV